MPRHSLHLAAVILCAVATGCGRTAVQTTPWPANIDLLSRSEWGASEPVLAMQPHEPSRITIHHTATKQDTARTLAQKMRSLQEFSQSRSALADGRMKEPWADIPYHFYVDVFGDVAEGRPTAFAGDSNTPYDPSGHVLVVFEGNFQEESLTHQQRRTMNILIPHLARRYGVEPARLGAHRDFASTACPGDSLYAEIPQLRALID